MALCGKHSGKQIVPWYSRDEWLDVYDKLYGPKHNETTRQQGLDILHIWESRTSHLPSGVIGTIIILNAHCQYARNYKNRDLQMLISAAILRFLNVCVTNDDRLGTFYINAKRMKVPRWVITLRHDIAHRQAIPSIELLMSALSFSVNWLHVKYWRPVRSELKDFVVTRDFTASSAARLVADLEPLINYYGYLCLVTHPFWSYVYVRDIKNETSRVNLLNFLRESRGHEVNEYTHIKQVLKLIWNDVRDVVFASDVPTRGAIVVDVLLGTECFLCDILDYKSIFVEKQPTKLPYEFVVIWEMFMRNLHKEGCLPLLIEKLVGVAKDKTDTRIRRLTSALWLAEIGMAISKVMSASKITSKVQNRCFTDGKSLNLNVFSEVPDIFQDWPSFKALILDTPNEYLLLYLPSMLRAHQSLKSEEMINQIVNVTRLYVAGFNHKKKAPVLDNCEVYMVRSSVPGDGGTEVALTGDQVVTGEVVRKFRRVTGVAELAKCALGVLPWQKSGGNPTF